MIVDTEISHTEALHTEWDNQLDPPVEVESGDIVRFECLNDSGDRITPETRAEELPSRSFIGHHLTGPVAVAGAMPGDVLQVDILEVNPSDWGYTLIRPGEEEKGLLSDEFPDPHLYHWDLDEEVGYFEHGIEIPLAPFPGVVGVAPASPRAHSTGPPRDVGGNLDLKHLTAGSAVYLPVAVSDALFSIGDGHAAQGDGEVCVSAIETPTTITVRLTLHSNHSLDRPRFETMGPFRPAGCEQQRTAVGTTGIGDCLMTASKDAVRGMIEYLETRTPLTPAESYMLCSVAGDLKINEIVDAPNWVVSMYLSSDIVETAKAA